MFSGRSVHTLAALAILVTLTSCGNHTDFAALRRLPLAKPPPGAILLRDQEIEGSTGLNARNAGLRRVFAMPNTDITTELNWYQARYKFLTKDALAMSLIGAEDRTTYHVDFSTALPEGVDPDQVPPSSCVIAVYISPLP